MGRERRQHERIEVGCAARLIFSDGTIVHGQMENISTGGCYIRSNEIAGSCRWESCSIAVLLEVNGMPQNLHLQARLIWSDQQGVGFGFEQLGQEQRDQLAILLRENRCE